PPNLPEGIWPVVLIVHDELTFNANDGRSKIWIKDDNVPLKKKSCGKGIMVSDFLTPGGQLQHPDSHLATCSIEYGRDTWWDGDQLVEQVLKLAISIFESAFPGCQDLWLFDNASSQSGHSKDALRACDMNLS
ncbi:hypothetical protein L873DRAFT_1559011, partial [Choiromyces venosus 120613-1]